MKRLLIVTHVLWLIGCSNEGPRQDILIIERYAITDTLSDWQVLQMAIIMTESEFYPDARGMNEDSGIFQITPIYVEDYNRISGEEYTIEDAFDVRKSFRMFSAMQDHYNPGQSIIKAIHRHNPGSSIGYENKVIENMAFIKRYEAIRTELIYEYTENRD